MYVLNEWGVDDGRMKHSVHIFTWEKSLRSDNMANNVTVLQQHHVYKLAKQIEMSRIWFLIDISVSERMSESNISIIMNCVKWLLLLSVISTQPYFQSHKSSSSKEHWASRCANNNQLRIRSMFHSISTKHCTNSLVLNEDFKPSETI